VRVTFPDVTVLGIRRPPEVSVLVPARVRVTLAVVLVKVRLLPELPLLTVAVAASPTLVVELPQLVVSVVGVNELIAVVDGTAKPDAGTAFPKTAHPPKMPFVAVVDDLNTILLDPTLTGLISSVPAVPSVMPPKETVSTSLLIRSTATAEAPPFTVVPLKV
jgi:hypothetical protein